MLGLEVLKIKSTRTKKWGFSIYKSNSRIYLEFNLGIRSYMIGV